MFSRTEQRGRSALAVEFLGNVTLKSKDTAHYNSVPPSKLPEISEAESSAGFKNQLDNYSDPWVFIAKTKQRLVSSSSINKQTHVLEGKIKVQPAGYKQPLTNGGWEGILRKKYCT